MMARFILILIPLLTFIIPQRWFSLYAMLMAGAAVYMVAMLTLLKDKTSQAFTSFGVEAVLGYLALNLALLGVRYWLIRRARERMLKLPAPIDKA
jgi:hypothetical protein